MLFSSKFRVDNTIGKGWGCYGSEYFKENHEIKKPTQTYHKTVYFTSNY